MNVLVLGASGMVGHVVATHFEEIGCDVTTLTRRASPFGRNVVGNLADESFLTGVLEKGSFDLVVNCVGVLEREAAENPARAVLINSYLPHLLADLTSSSSTRVIQISTDCVFKGTSPPYFEDTWPDGPTTYDRTKAMGELRDDKNLTLRMSVIGPDTNTEGIGLFNWFMRQEKEVNGYRSAIWTGVTSVFLARAIEHAWKVGWTGLVNLVNNESISKADLLSLFNREFRGGSIRIHPSDVLVVDKSLRTRRRDVAVTVPSYEEMVVDMRHWVEGHPALYPHYFGAGRLAGDLTKGSLG
jgi:dTDP-4-dehydrorhamnose reductase